MQLHPIDDDERLYIAPAIDDWAALAAHRIDVVLDLDGGIDAGVPTRPGGIVYLYFPIVDAELPRLERLHAVARMAAELHRHGHAVLSHCGAGFNRSALVAGVILTHLGWSGADAVARLQERRPGALFNDVFRDYLVTLPAQRQSHP